MRICMVAGRHTLDDARIVHKQAVALREAGHEVVLLFSCDGSWQYRRLDGTVLAIGRAPNGEACHMGFMVFGLPKRSVRHKYWQYRDLSKLAAAIEADVYHAHEPDIALAAAVRAKAILASRGHRALVVHDMHEYPPGGTADSAPGWLQGSMHAALIMRDKLLARRVDHVFTANSIVRGYSLLLSRHTPVDVVYNGPALRLFPQSDPPRWEGPPAPLVVCHEGSLGFGRGLKEMVDAVDQLRDHVHLRIVGDVFGDVRTWLDEQIVGRRLESVVSRTGWLSYAEVGSAVRQAHVGLILFRDTRNNVLAGPPNKLFNYMNAGVPVLSVGFPELRRIVGREKCGVIVADQTVTGIVAGLERLLAAGPDELRKMGRAGQEAIRSRYSWEVMEATLLGAYEEIADRSKTR